MMAKEKKQRKIQGSNNGKRGYNKGHENVRSQGFHTNPERINKKGRPPKLWNDFNSELEAKGYTGLKDAQLLDAYKRLLQLPEAEIDKIEKDKTNPYPIRLMIKYMKSSRGMEMLDRIIDRAYGKAHQVFEVQPTTFKIEGVPEEHMKSLAEFEDQMKKIDQEHETIDIQHKEIKGNEGANTGME